MITKRNVRFKLYFFCTSFYFKLISIEVYGKTRAIDANLAHLHIQKLQL